MCLCLCEAFFFVAPAVMLELGGKTLSGCKQLVLTTIRAEATSERVGVCEFKRKPGDMCNTNTLLAPLGIILVE